MLLKSCFLTIIKRRNKQTNDNNNKQKCRFFIIFISFYLFFLILAKGVLTSSCFLLIQLSVASQNPRARAYDLRLKYKQSLGMQI